MNGHEKLKRAFKKNTGARLTADEVWDLINSDVAIRDALYPDFEEFTEDRKAVVLKDVLANDDGDRRGIIFADDPEY